MNATHWGPGPVMFVLGGLFLVGMFLPRFFLEFTTEGPVVFAGMNTGQGLSVPLVIAGALLLGQSGWRTKPRARRGAAAPRSR